MDRSRGPHPAAHRIQSSGNQVVRRTPQLPEVGHQYLWRHKDVCKSVYIGDYGRGTKKNACLEFPNPQVVSGACSLVGMALSE